ncbi:MAG: cation diffusion facilitator family transporter [Idiomarina sp.]|nr:cation diffusion facilitator family transporter [Idiomarina sp.]
MSSGIQKRALIFSAISASVFALAGLLLGVLSGSVMIIFDSAYSLLSLALALLSLSALSLAQRPANDTFQFGRLTIEPLSILVKGVVIGLVCVASIAVALVNIWQGGREVHLNIALIFAVLNVLGCWLTWGVLSRTKQRTNTPLIRAETNQWKMDTWLSAAVLLGFSLAYLLARSPWSHLSVYADPVMVIIIAGYFAHIPLQMIRQSLHQLLLGSPRGELLADMNAVIPVEQIEHIRLAQVGSFLILQYDGASWPDEVRNNLVSLAEAHQLTPMLITPGSKVGCK